MINRKTISEGFIIRYLGYCKADLEDKEIGIPYYL
jgi:hypothetical protein